MDGRKLQDKKMDSFFQHPCVVSWMKLLFIRKLFHYETIIGLYNTGNMLETFKMPFFLHASLHVLSAGEILLRGGQGVTLLIIITELTQPFPKTLTVSFLGFSSLLRDWKIQKKKLPWKKYDDIQKTSDISPSGSLRECLFMSLMVPV